MIWKAAVILGVVLGANGHAISEQKIIRYYKEYQGHHGELAHLGEHKPEHHQVYADAYPLYEFSYKVEDPHTHDFKGQEEKRDGDVTKGSYWLIQPDGVKRTVVYEVDGKSGFLAKVHYSHPHHEHENKEREEWEREERIREERKEEERKREEWEREERKEEERKREEWEREERIREERKRDEWEREERKKEERKREQWEREERERLEREREEKEKEEWERKERQREEREREEHEERIREERIREERIREEHKRHRSHYKHEPKINIHHEIVKHEEAKKQWEEPKRVWEEPERKQEEREEERREPEKEREEPRKHWEHKPVYIPIVKYIKPEVPISKYEHDVHHEIPVLKHPEQIEREVSPHAPILIVKEPVHVQEHHKPAEWNHWNHGNRRVSRKSTGKQ